MVRAMCVVQFKYGKGSADLMSMLGWHETIDQLAIAASDCWYGHVMRRVDCHFLRRH